MASLIGISNGVLAARLSCLRRYRDKGNTKYHGRPSNQINNQIVRDHCEPPFPFTEVVKQPGKANNMKQNGEQATTNSRS